MNITRQQQILSLIKRIVSTELWEINHELFHNAVITTVILSNDGRECRIWVDAPAQTIHLLQTKYAHEIQHAFMKKFARKVVPQLIFLQDTGEIDHLTAVLENVPHHDQDSTV